MIGAGKLGLPVALAIESRGHEVRVYDINPEIKTYLEKRRIPYREEGLQPLLDCHSIQWCDSIADAVKWAEIVFVAIQTPHQPEYEGITPLPDTRVDFDYTHLKSALAEIAEACEKFRPESEIAVISTCLPGTFEREIKPLLNDEVSYVYAPQFIAMGTVLEDYLNPEFNLIGIDNALSAAILTEFYKTINDAPPVVTDITTAEGIKVSYNTIVTAKTVIANAWGELSERLGMNFDDIKKAWDLSTKRLISPKYLNAGMSDGGGCHCRDNIAMSWLAQEVGMSHNVWEDLMVARESYEAWHASVAAQASIQYQLPLVILGTAFKPETDITTGSPAVLMANILYESGLSFFHVDDIGTPVPRAVYFIATANSRYRDYPFPTGSVVLDPFGMIPDIEGVTVRRLGRK